MATAHFKASFFALAALLSLTSGCKKTPHVGEPCTPGQGVCADATSMTACIGGVFASMPCHGAAGCKVEGNISNCDNSLSSAGDACDEVGDYACAVGLKSALSCQGNRLLPDGTRFVVEETCKGPQACALKKDGLYCDNDISDPGDPCHAVGDYACTGDKKLALKCGADHTMAPMSTCKGAKGCRVLELPEQNKVEFVCDDAVADPNDPCDENGEEACTIDRKGLLRCEGNKFAPLKACAGGCSFDPSGDKFVCDDGAGATSPASGGAKKPSKRGR